MFLVESRNFVLVFSFYLDMTRLKIDVLNPKAVKILQDLADLNLIFISDISDMDVSNPKKASIDYSKFQFTAEQLKFNRDEINEKQHRRIG